MAPKRPAYPLEVTQIAAELKMLPAVLGDARRIEAEMRENVRDAKDTLDIEIANALLTANGQVDGKNEEERKVKRAAYLGAHPTVRAAQQALNAAESRLTNASLHIREAEDQLAVKRAIARLVCAGLEYIASGE